MRSYLSSLFRCSTASLTILACTLAKIRSMASLVNGWACRATRSFISRGSSVSLDILLLLVTGCSGVLQFQHPRPDLRKHSAASDTQAPDGLLEILSQERSPITALRT